MRPTSKRLRSKSPCAARIKATEQAIKGRPKGSMTGHGLQPTKLKPWLYLGRYSDVKDDTWMRDHGITHVINCLDKRMSPPSRVLDRLQTYVYLSSLDTVGFPLFHDTTRNSHAATGSSARRPMSNWDLVQDVLLDVKAKYEAGKPVAAFIYCMAGLNRSATLAAAFLAVHCFGNQRQGIERVAEFIREKRPGALSNPGFVKQLARVLHKDCVDER